MNRVVIAKGRERSVLKGHPWVFSGAVAEGSGEPGEIVRVFSSSGGALGWGAYSPASQIRVRMLSRGGETPDVRALVAASVARRAGAGDGWTNAARLVNAESDGLPGVVADSYDGHIVCQFTSAFAERFRNEIARALMDSFPGAKGVSARDDVDVREKEGLSTGGFSVLAGVEPPELVEIREGSVRLLVDVRRGHKTGFYLDQREARAAVGKFAAGRSVLNCFCYTGGFGLHAAVCGARSVEQVDISGDALELARRNWNLTLGEGASSPDVGFVEADVFKHLRSCRDAARKFDLIVMDPPKFASVKSQVMKAARGYKDINLLAMKLLSPGGILATFSCSGAMTEDLFSKVVAEAALDSGRNFQTIAATRQAADHPVSVFFPEGLYLKGLILRAMD